MTHSDVVILPIGSRIISILTLTVDLRLIGTSLRGYNSFHETVVSEKHHDLQHNVLLVKHITPKQTLLPA